MSQQLFKKASRGLSAALRKRRAALGLTQEDVADKLGMVPRQYQKIEAGLVNVTLRTLVRLAVALETELRKLFTL